MIESLFVERLAAQILQIYREIDEKTSRLKERTGLRCKKDCGECCSKGSVHIAPIEFLPLSLELYRRKEAEKYLEIIRGRENDMCVLYVPKRDDMTRGYCSFYQFRAATCRLYGFGFKRNKYGYYEPVMCNYLKQKFLALPQGEFEKDQIADYDSTMIRIFAIYPSLAEKRYPVNLALLLALEKVGLIQLVSLTHYKYKADTNYKKDGENKENGIER